MTVPQVIDPQRPRPVLAVAACDFGWGSFGKLRVILDELPDVDFALVAGAHAAEVIDRLLGARHSFVEIDLMEADAALVINDPSVANHFAEEGLHVVYVDSLPYLWTTPEEVPISVDVYCAQRTPGGEPATSGPLAARDDIVWVEPIVPRPVPLGASSGIVVNVGGLHSHLSGRAEDAYIQLVLLPLVELLLDQGRHVSAVCGNIPEWTIIELGRKIPHAALGLQNAYAFHDLVRAADLLFTSPGSTTLLQAVTSGVRTIALPPQNLSQILNATLFRGHTEATVPWPESVLDLRVVEGKRPLGEDPVLEHIYGELIRAASSPELKAQVRDSLADLTLTLPEQDRSVAMSPLENGGAEQVARHINDLLAGLRSRS